MAKRTTRKQLVLQEKAEELRQGECLSAPFCTEGDEYVVEVLSATERKPVFIPFPLVPIEKGDPLWHCEWCCPCGCRRMPRGLLGGICIHCGHCYQRGDPLPEDPG
jgi:hypothetical protein